MNHVAVYEEYDPETDYIGKPIDKFYFKNDKCDLLLEITVFDNKTYLIDFFAHDHKEYKRIESTSLAANDNEFNRIDPEFRNFLTAQLQRHYDL